MKHVKSLFLSFLLQSNSLVKALILSKLEVDNLWDVELFLSSVSKSKLPKILSSASQTFSKFCRSIKTLF